MLHCKKMVRLAMIYDTDEIGTVSHPIMSVELDEEITQLLRNKERHIEEQTLFVGNTATIRIEDIEVEIRTSRINNTNGSMRKLLSPKE